MPPASRATGGCAPGLVTEVIGKFDPVGPDRALYRLAGPLIGENAGSLDADPVTTALGLKPGRLIACGIRQAGPSGAGLVAVSPT